MTSTLQTPTTAHYAELASWIQDAHQCAHWAGAKLSFPFLAADLPELLHTEPCDTCALIGSAGRMLGFGQILLRREAGTGHLGRIIVNPALRGTGLGKVLCTQLIERGVATHGFRSMTLWVYVDNPAAVRLYESLGFRPEAREGNEGCQFMRLLPGRA
ncbi:MAG: GNAT family N-acetyltransferase [Burkholderiales bacterium]|nr:GNAT family N-acetyltransferase [Burkholderiales bacterium]